MNTLLTKWVWVERAMILLATIGVNLGIVTSSQETDVAAGGVIGTVVFVQIVMTCVTHWRTFENTMRAQLADALSKLMTYTPAVPVTPPVPFTLPTAPVTPVSITATTTPPVTPEMAAAVAAGKAQEPATS